MKEGILTDDELEYLSMKIEYWRPLARRLLFPEETIKAFDIDYVGLREQVFQMLYAWKRRDGSDASYKVLYDALCHPLVNRRDLAERFCLMWPSLVST